MGQKVENTTKDDKWLGWVGGRNPSALINQEEKGQEQFVASEQLPRECNSPYGVKNICELYHKMGIKTMTPSKGDGDLFMGVQLPKGWKKEATDHSMWSKLLDEQGRERASIFYKGSAHDRKAHISINRRIHIRVDRIGFIKGDYSQDANHEYNSRNTPYCGVVEDYDGTFLFKTEEMPCKEEYAEPNNKGGYSEKYKEEMRTIEGKLKSECLAFVEKHYPNYEDVLAYWDLEIKK